MVLSTVVESRASPEALDARDALRHATATLHAEVDASLPLARPSPTLADYREHLQLLSDWTAALRHLPGNAERLDAQAAALDIDLAGCDRWLGVRPTPAQSAPAIDAVPADIADPAAFAWGVAYVIEGSQLGGQVLYRRLAEPLAPHPLAYLQGAGRETGARWKAFLAALREQLASPAEVQSACDGAVAAFALLLRLHRRQEVAA